MPGLVLRTTFIVGFPGETDKDFAELLDFCETAKFDNVGVFKYSPEEGTPAYKFKDRVDEETIDERYLTLLDIQNMISGEIAKAACRTAGTGPVAGDRFRRSRPCPRMVSGAGG